MVAEPTRLYLGELFLSLAPLSFSHGAVPGEHRVPAGLPHLLATHAGHLESAVVRSEVFGEVPMVWRLCREQLAQRLRRRRVEGWSHLAGVTAGAGRLLAPAERAAVGADDVHLAQLQQRWRHVGLAAVVEPAGAERGGGAPRAVGGDARRRLPGRRRAPPAVERRCDGRRPPPAAAAARAWPPGHVRRLGGRLAAQPAAGVLLLFLSLGPLSFSQRPQNNRGGALSRRDLGWRSEKKRQQVAYMYI